MKRLLTTLVLVFGVLLYSCDNAADRGIKKLPAPTLSMVTATGPDSVKVSWSEVDNADGYFVYYSETSSIETSQHSRRIYDTTSLIDLGFDDYVYLEPKTKYYFWVKALGDGYSYEDSDYSNSKSVTTKLETPVIYLGSKTSSSVNVSVYYVEGAERIEFRLNTVDDFNSAKIIDEVEQEDFGTIFTISDLTKGTKYYIYVRAWDKDGMSDVSKISFTL